MQQKLAEKERLQKEQHLRSFARKAREDRARGGAVRSPSCKRSRSRSLSYSRSLSRSISRSPTADNDARGRQEREKARRDRKQENERSLRQSHMGTERRLQQMARAEEPQKA